MFFIDFILLWLFFPVLVSEGFGLPLTIIWCLIEGKWFFFFFLLTMIQERRIYLTNVWWQRYVSADVLILAPAWENELSVSFGQFDFWQITCYDSLLNLAIIWKDLYSWWISFFTQFNRNHMIKLYCGNWWLHHKHTPLLGVKWPEFYVILVPFAVFVLGRIDFCCNF